MSDSPSWHIGEDTLHLLRRFYTVWGIFFFLVGIGGALWSLRDLGQPYPGAIWNLQVENRQFVSFDFLPETTMRLRQQHEYLPGERIVAVNGIPITEKIPDYREASVGDIWLYTIRRPDGTLDERSYTIRLYTLEEWYYSNGALILIGLSNLLAGWLLLLRARNHPMVVLAFIFGIVSISGIQHGWFGCISTCTRSEWLASHFAMGILNVFYEGLLISTVYFLTIYPDTLISPRFSQHLRRIGYGYGALDYISAQLNRISQVLPQIPPIAAFLLMQIVLAITLSLAIIIILWRTFRYPHIEYRLFGFVFSGGMVLLLIGSVFVFNPKTPFWIAGGIVYPISILYPFLVYYAIHNQILIHDLQPTFRTLTSGK